MDVSVKRALNYAYCHHKESGLGNNVFDGIDPDVICGLWKCLLMMPEAG